ncbi:MAG: transketolase [Pseudomonadota bacterium]
MADTTDSAFELTEAAAAVRALAMDAVQAANSGHPGAPMGLADVADVLWREVVRHNPTDPAWLNRDRFVLSNGHGSMLLYAMLHLSGYDVSIDDIRQFRQLHSKTAGHPEYGECPGVETTTGPLGQGIANGVGMALAEQRLAAEFNRPGHEIVDHRTFVVLGDGCLMEGISHEACSLAGTLGLGKLKAIWDDNGISIDGEVDAWFSEDVPARFEAYGWRVIRDVDGHDTQAIRAALADACADDSKPVLVCTRTTIGLGAPTKAGTAGAHGSPLGDDEIAGARQRLNWGYAPFEIPEHVYALWDCREKGAAAQSAWVDAFEAYREAYPELAADYERRMRGDLAPGWDASLMHLAERAQDELKSLATRKSSQACLTALAPGMPELFGGSADLTGSNGTRWDGADEARYMSYGVREFGMSAITNGMALHGGLIPFSGTFLVFMEYARNAVRLASLMGIRNVFVYTHDSVAVGEDGPTHQPIEQLTNLRTTPNLSTWRPCDTVETAVAWRAALARRDGPSAIILTRQNTVAQPRDAQAFEAIGRGGYVLVRERGALDIALIATGSEVEVAVAAAATLAEEGVGARVISMPSVDTFLAQDAAYRDAVLPAECTARVAIEAGHPDYWYRFVGLQGAVVGIDRYGVSAPGDTALEHLGISESNLLEAARGVLLSSQKQP